LIYCNLELSSARTPFYGVGKIGTTVDEKAKSAAGITQNHSNYVDRQAHVPF